MSRDKVLVNCYRDSRRRRRWGEHPAERLPGGTAADAVDGLAHVDTEDAVQRALGSLSVANRAAIVLRFYAHLSEQETAEALGIAVGTVKSRTSRALARLATNPHLIETTDGNLP